jgi:hypothetical protein
MRAARPAGSLNGGRIIADFARHVTWFNKLAACQASPAGPN